MRRAAGKLSHQHLIQVYDAGKFEGKYYFSMEYIDGVTVEDLIAHDGQLPVDKVVDIAIQVLSALSYLVRNNIVHRDIKPANIMLDKDGSVKLGDFGFIQNHYDQDLLQEGTTLGTPDYISPEQAKGERLLDVRSDLYSLGASMFHMLGGQPPFKGRSSQVMRDHIDAFSPDLNELRANLPADLMWSCVDCLRKNPDNRFSTPDEVEQELQLVKLEEAGGTGQLPGTRSQIINVINAEKTRIDQLEASLGRQRTTVTVLVIAALVGWVGAIVFAVLWLLTALIWSGCLPWSCRTFAEPGSGLSRSRGTVDKACLSWRFSVVLAQAGSWCWQAR